MAPEDRRRKSHRKHTSRSTRRRDEVERDEPEEAGAQDPVRPTVDELREARLAYLAQSPEERREKMKFIGETTRTETTTRAEGRPRTTTVASRSRRPETKRKRSEPSRARVDPESDDDEYVYGRPEPIVQAAEQDIPSRAPTTRKAETTRRSQTRRTSSNHVVKHSEERRMSSRRNTEPVKRRNSFGIDERNPPDRYARDRSCCILC